MVINGTRGSKNHFTLVEFEGDRIRLPAQFVEAAGLAGKEAIHFWLLVVNPGRFRLVKQTGAAPIGDLSRIIRHIEQTKEPGDVLDGIDSNADAAIGARLIPCVVSPRGPGWRIYVPKEVKRLGPGSEEPSFVFLLIVAGFVELWFPETLKRATSVPFSEILS